ncbi:MAG: hypothetical protein ACT4NJ_01405 [Nitrosopumilaceae archaeon]
MKKIFYSLIVLVLISSIPLISAQITLGNPADQKLVKITINEQSEVHVLHEILHSNSVVQINTIEGTLSNLKVIDTKGNDVEYGTTGLESTTGITIFSSEEDVIIEYDLEDALFVKDGMWTWDFLYLQTTTFILPESLDLVYVNNNPVMLQNAKGITCHGCRAIIEYVLDQPTNTNEVQWEDRKFIVGIRSLADISSLNFDQSTKSISFDVEEDNQLITLIIPLDLLWSPYEVYLDDEKILKHEFFSNQTHAWLNIRPETSGIIQIIGTTVVPEFPVLSPLFIGIAIIIGLQLKNRINPR